MLRASFLRPVPCSSAHHSLGLTRAAVLGVKGGRVACASSAILDRCSAEETRYDAAWLDQEELLYRKLLPDGSFFKELEGEVRYANLDDMVAAENWEALAEISRGLSTVFGSKVRLTVDGLDLDLRAPFTPAINGTASNR